MTPPNWREVAHRTGTVALAPFIPAVLADGPDDDSEFRDEVSRTARAGDDSILPVLIARTGLSAVRGGLASRRDSDLLALEAGPSAEPPEFTPAWTPDIDDGPWS